MDSYPVCESPLAWRCGTRVVAWDSHGGVGLGWGAPTRMGHSLGSARTAWRAGVGRPLGTAARRADPENEDGPLAGAVCSALEGTRTPNLLIRRRNSACSFGFVSYQIMPLSCSFIAVCGRDDTSQHRDVSDGLIHFRYAFEVASSGQTVPWAARELGFAGRLLGLCVADGGSEIGTCA